MATNVWPARMPGLGGPLDAPPLPLRRPLPPRPQTRHPSAQMSVGRIRGVPQRRQPPPPPPPRARGRAAAAAPPRRRTRRSRGTCTAAGGRDRSTQRGAFKRASKGCQLSPCTHTLHIMPHTHPRAEPVLLLGGQRGQGRVQAALVVREPARPVVAQKNIVAIVRVEAATLGTPYLLGFNATAVLRCVCTREPCRCCAAG